MSSGTEQDQSRKIQSYYQQSEKAYLNWGRDLERDGIYALHCGFERSDEPVEHWESVKQLTRELILFMGIDKKDIILDAGCGVGAASFEIKSQYPQATIHGINLALNQLRVAQLFAETSVANRMLFSQQDYMQTAFPDSYFDKVVFVESIAHAQTKVAAIKESGRILRNGGYLFIADVFFKRAPVSAEEVRWVEEIRRGWLMPDLNSIDTFTADLERSGFSSVECIDISGNTLPSTLRMRENAEKRLSEEPDSQQPVTDEIHNSREGIVASHKVLESGLVGYFFIKAKKE